MIHSCCLSPSPPTPPAILCYSNPGELIHLSRSPWLCGASAHPAAEERGKAGIPARGPSKSQCLGTEHPGRPVAWLWGRVGDEEHRRTRRPGQAKGEGGWAVGLRCGIYCNTHSFFVPQRLHAAASRFSRAAALLNPGFTLDIFTVSVLPLCRLPRVTLSTSCPQLPF